VERLPRPPRDDASLPDALGDGEASFDWDAVFRALGEGAEVSGDEQREDLARALGDVLAWLVDGAKYHRGPAAQRHIARRVIALLWVIRPDALESKSLAAFARRMGVSRKKLSRHSVAVARQWGVAAAGSRVMR
jgi:hypothetical protein